MKSYCHFLFNHFGLPTLQNSTQFSNSNSLIPLAINRLSLYSLGRTPWKTRATCQNAWSGPYKKHLFCYPLQSPVMDHSRKHSLSTAVRLHLVGENVFTVRCIATIRAWITENNAPLLFTACVLRALPSNGCMRHNIYVVQCWELLDQFWTPIVPCCSTEDTVRIVNSFITIPITRNYNHSQLFLTLLHMYTAYNHLYVRNYNHLFHSYTFTQYIYVWLYNPLLGLGRFFRF
jgi:hypothetical protein